MLGGLVPLLGSWWASTWVLPSAAWKNCLYFKLDTACAYCNRFPFTFLYRTRSLYLQSKKRGMRFETISQQQQLPTPACEAYARQSISPAGPHTPAATSGSQHPAPGSCRGCSPRGCQPRRGTCRCLHYLHCSGKAFFFVT